jgi:hypothetical protein
MVLRRSEESMRSAKLKRPNSAPSSGATWDDYGQIADIMSPRKCALARFKESE